MKFKLAKKINLSLALLMTMSIAGSCTAATNPTSVKTQYQNSSENFANPDRGFYVTYSTTNTESPLQLSNLQNARSNNLSLIRRIYHIPQFRNSTFDQSFLDFVTKDFETARKAGVKLVLLFMYNSEWEGPDAPRDIILTQLDQLKPIFRTNKDVIAYMEAGFIGSWGEWHHSTNGLDNNEDRKAILNKILSVLPTEKMVALRYPQHKIDIFNNSNSLTPQEAFNGSYRARTGANNNCFVADYADGGTYDWNNSDSTKNFLNLDNRYVVQGGETCETSATSGYGNCPNALKDLERMRWTYLNSEFEQATLQGWKDQGCMEEVKRRLGYRFRLLDSAIPSKVKPAGTFSMSFKVTNDGWATLYNPHSLEVILRNPKTGQQYYLPVAEAVRMWMPGEVKVVNITGGIPASMPAGEYQVLLNLPDTSATLYKRREYSIRFANQNVWQATTGYNSLQRSVTVDPSAGGDSYSGNQYFKSR